MLVIPGNHDARHVGYVHFEELIGPRSCVLHEDGVTLVGVDSHRARPGPRATSAGPATAGWRSSSRTRADFRIFMLHHHLLPVPGTGRERNIVYDAGDVLEVLQRCG